MAQVDRGAKFVIAWMMLQVQERGLRAIAPLCEQADAAADAVSSAQ